MALHIYGDESGQVGGKHFLIGLLFVDSRSNLEYEQQLQKLKLQHKFTHRELHYSELNRFKSDFAKVVVDWYLGAADAVFKCTVVPGGIFDLGRFRDNMKFMSAKDKARPDEFQRFLLANVPNVVGMQEAPSLSSIATSRRRPR